MSSINSVMNFTPFASFHGTQADLEQLLESEMEQTWKKVDELKNKNKEKPKTLEEQATEIKKKFKTTGVKRRIAVSEQEASAYMNEHQPLEDHSQIAREIDYLVKRGNLAQKMFIAYHRKAFSGIEERDLRITFDTDICYRLDHLSLHKTGEEKMITNEEDVLMEIKVSDRYPLWLTEILTELKLYRQTFSKYGTIYSELESRRRCETTAVPVCRNRPAFHPVYEKKENMTCLTQS